MKEEVTLIFKDGTKFVWRTWKLGDIRKVLSLHKKHGDPIEIIGDGIVAQTLRDKYKVYNVDPKNYHPDIFGTASKFSGMVKEELEEKFNKISKKLKIKRG